MLTRTNSTEKTWGCEIAKMRRDLTHWVTQAGRMNRILRCGKDGGKDGAIFPALQDYSTFPIKWFLLCQVINAGYWRHP